MKPLHTNDYGETFFVQLVVFLLSKDETNKSNYQLCLSIVEAMTHSHSIQDDITVKDQLLVGIIMGQHMG